MPSKEVVTMAEIEVLVVADIDRGYKFPKHSKPIAVIDKGNPHEGYIFAANEATADAVRAMLATEGVASNAKFAPWPN
jgi:hypothetical protein